MNIHRIVAAVNPYLATAALAFAAIAAVGCATGLEPSPDGSRELDGAADAMHAADTLRADASFGTDAASDVPGDESADSAFDVARDLPDDAPTTDTMVTPDVDDATNCAQPTATAANPRGSDTPVYANPTYDYSPSVMLDGVYRIWWCCGSSSGGVSGDHICYAEASTLDGPWHSHSSATPNTHDEVFHGTGNVSDFDGTHTCDPSVVRVDGTYYMYYGGISENAPSPTWTRIGVASSPDGFTWTRMNGGQAIIDSARDPYTNNLPTYGTGQPSVTYVDGMFYLVRTDLSGYATVGSAGQYVLRSADPTFQTGVEQLSATGFVPFDATTSTDYTITTQYWAGDWQFVDALDAFAIAESVTDANAITVHLYSRTFATVGAFAIPGHWTEEPAIVSRPDRHAAPWGGGCGTLAMDVMRSVGTPGSPGTWDLAHAGVDLQTNESCACAPLAAMLEGTLLAVPNTPLTLVRAGGRLQFQLGPPAVRLARTQIDPGIDVFNAIPYAASVYSGNRAIATQGSPGGYVLDDGRFWPVSCPGELTDDMTSLTFVDAATYQSYPQGPPLFCLQ